MQPRVINVDGHAACQSAIAELRESGELSQRCQYRRCPYLNNVLEVLLHLPRRQWSIWLLEGRIVVTLCFENVGSPMTSSSFRSAGICAFKLSYRDLAQVMGELGVRIAPCTILRWVIRYAVPFAEHWRQFQKPVGRSWRCDETYVKVGGRWMYLLRAVDERGSTVESHLSRRRDVNAAKAFFRKALKHHGQPRTITLDRFEPTHAALRRMGMRNEFNYRWRNPVKIRSCAYLNNIVEQDHRRIKARVLPMFGFKRFFITQPLVSRIRSPAGLVAFQGCPPEKNN
jgi:transposase-like protein